MHHQCDFNRKQDSNQTTQGQILGEARAQLGKIDIQYVFAFEIAAFILLVAIIAAISLTLRRRPTTKYQTPGNQVKVKREDRIRMVKNMDAEVKE